MPVRGETLPLPFGESPPLARPAPQPSAPAAERLWLCLYFMDVIAPASAAGADAGEVGRAVGDPLRPCAMRLLRFTPAVSIDPCGALLLEIAGSAHLFGGPAQLQALAVEEVVHEGRLVRSAIAPTARAALWLAAAGENSRVMALRELPAALAPLSLPLPGWPAPLVDALRHMGIRRLGECLRLPRAGLARRMGAAWVGEIDEALGRHPEVRPTLRPVLRFREVVELPARTCDTGLLMAGVHGALARLGTHLRAHQAGVSLLRLQLCHRLREPTRVRVGLLRPCTDIAHLARLVATHLGGLQLPAAVEAVVLDAETADWHGQGSSGLFGTGTQRGERMAALVERLRARLGPDGVQGIGLHGEHRPERAWRTVAEPLERTRHGAAMHVPAVPRPLWLLTMPVPLEMRAGRPVYQGPVQFERGPERIESGWWDGGDVRRDYHVARNRHGARLWIFRDACGGWYLHGLFG
jgi:protein ImuB